MFFRKGDKVLEVTGKEFRVAGLRPWTDHSGVTELLGVITAYAPVAAIAVPAMRAVVKAA